MNPEDGKLYKIYGDHCWGEWTAVATCKYYKGKETYRWIMSNGSTTPAREVNKFEEIK